MVVIVMVVVVVSIAIKQSATDLQSSMFSVMLSN